MDESLEWRVKGRVDNSGELRARVEGGEFRIGI
jgi:hypothetical protein